MSNTFNLVLNSSYVIGINKTTYVYNFIVGNYRIPSDSEITISQITIPYSWFNVNASLYINSSFSYIWYGSGSSYVTYTVTLPNGNYAVSDINN